MSPSTHPTIHTQPHPDTHNPRTTNACTYHPRMHTPSTHAHTNNNPSSDHAHTHTDRHKRMIEGMCVFLFCTKMIQTRENCSNFVRNSYELPTNFLQTSYEIPTKFVTTTFTVPMYEALRGRNSCEFRMNFAPFLHDTGRKATPTPPMHAPKSPHTHTHISLHLPPRHTHTHTHTHKHTQTHKHFPILAPPAH